MKHFSSLQDYHKYLRLPKPLHPMFSVVVFDPNEPLEMLPSSPPISTDLYTIKLKWDSTCELIYDRTKYDFSSGSLIFLAPGQIVGWDSSVSEIEQNGIMLLIHKEFLRASEIEKPFMSGDQSH